MCRVTEFDASGFTIKLEGSRMHYFERFDNYLLTEFLYYETIMRRYSANYGE